MKAKFIVTVLISFCTLAVFSQQPFKEYGYKVKVATLSKGKYVEFFDQDTLIQIGTVVMNRFTKQIVSFVTVDTTYSEATLQPELISRWISPDPLAEKYYNFSPYHFSGNNPIRFVDPTGMAFIDYYNQGGDKIGTDGNNDGRVVVVTDKSEAKSIKATDKAGGTTSMANVKSGVELPSASVRGEMGKAVDRSNSPTSDDKQGGFHEEGGIFGKDSNGNEVVNAAQPGAYSDPMVQDKAQVNVFSGDNGTIGDVEGTFHVHPSGEIRPGSNTIGGTIANFDQSPSPDDYSAAAANAKSGAVTGNNYVLGARTGQVTIYNGSGPIATFPLKTFTTVGIKK